MNDINTDILNIISSKHLNVLIYPHLPFNLSDGGTTVHYYLAEVLDSKGLNVKICNVYDNNASNIIFNKFSTVNEIDFENTIIIYCEGIIGNPLNAKYVVRWMLSKLGQNVPHHRYNSWGPNELVYFFNSENEFVDSNTQVKMLSLFYINPMLQNHNLERKGTCHSFRKKIIHKNIDNLHKPSSFEVTRQHTQNDYVEIFNKYKLFLSYDPLSFLNIIAAICGCISIVYPIQGVSKKDFFKKTAFYEYMVDTNNYQMYGIAYGVSENEINYSKNTLHLAKEQLFDIQKWFINKYINNFIFDIYNWNNNMNTLISYKEIMLSDWEFDIEFYKLYKDLSHMSSEELINHYVIYGKNEERIASENQFYILYPEFDKNNYINSNPNLIDHSYVEVLNHYHCFGKYTHFDVEFYKLYKDLSHMSSKELVNHYKTYGINENRIASKKRFYELYPIFDLEFYKLFNPKINSYGYAELFNYYHNYGSKEGHLISRIQFNYLYPDFDVEIYKICNKDLSNNIYIDLLIHYHIIGNREKRIANKKHLNKSYNGFDIDFYKLYLDLNHMSYEELINHYKSYGINENRIGCKDKFYELYPDFDIEFYKLFNPVINSYGYAELFNHYHNNYDFSVNDDYTVSIINNKLHNLIYNQHFYRNIDTYEKLVEYRKQFNKKYYIHSKQSFYKYYINFDYESYKNIYFKDNDGISEIEVLLHYHLNNNKNNKTNIILYIPPYDIKCGGITVLHYFAKLINEKYNEKYCAKLFMYNNLKYKNPFCNDFADFDDIKDNSIVIYPETVSGNPLNAKRVVRWILLELGIEMPLDHYKKWGSRDLIYHWEKIYKQLACPFFNNVFTNKNQNDRTKTCYLVKKGPLIHKNINYIHPGDSIRIDNLSLSQISDVFNECKFFYTYDPNSAYIIYSAVCGCIPIIYEIDGVNEEEYFKSKMYNFNDEIYNKGIVYGNYIHKINYVIENNLNQNNEEYYRNLFKIIEEQTIPLFLNDIS